MWNVSTQAAYPPDIQYGDGCPLPAYSLQRLHGAMHIRNIKIENDTSGQK